MQPLNSMPAHNLFGLEQQDYSKARIVVLPIPYDSATTYQSGARDGPKAIIDASRFMELYSVELGFDVSKKVGIFTMDELAPNLDSPRKMLNEIKKEVEIMLTKGKVPLLLGGDHSITIGALEAFKQQGTNLSVVQFDAHSDSRDNIFGSKYTHASVMARAAEMFDKTVHVGTRSMDEDSAKKLKPANIIYADEFYASKTSAIAEKIAKRTGKEIYITIDLDVLDPSEMPSVGTPEPAGVRFKQLCEVLHELSKTKKLAGFDITELKPTPGNVAPDYLAAKLAYLIIGYFFC